VSKENNQEAPSKDEPEQQPEAKEDLSKTSKEIANQSASPQDGENEKPDQMDEPDREDIDSDEDDKKEEDAEKQTNEEGEDDQKKADDGNGDAIQVSDVFLNMNLPADSKKTMK